MSETEVAVKAEEASIETEYAEEPGTRVKLDRDGVRAVAPEFGALIAAGQAAATGAEAKQRLLVLGLVVAAAIARLDGTVARYDRSLPLQQRYGPLTRDSVRRLGRIYARVRRRLDKRLGRTELDDQIRKLAGVGAVVDLEVVMDVRDRARAARAVLVAREYLKRFEARAIEAGLLAAQLGSELDTLESELRKGIVSEPKLGAAADELQHDLRCVEIALERTIGALDDHGSPQLAQELSSRIPVKRVTRRGTPPPSEAPAATTATTATTPVLPATTATATE
jgi:hypothetical protein